MSQSAEDTTATRAERHPITGEYRHGRISARALVLGALGALVIGYLAPYSIHVVHGSFMELDFSTPMALFFFFFLAAGPNLLVLRLRRSLALSPAELVTVYGMMIMASAIVTMGLTSQIIPVVTGPAYYASPQNKFAEEVLPYIKPWLMPRGTGPGTPVVKYLYEGLPPGQGVPWAAWMPCLLGWAPMLVALYVAMICSMVLLRKQWVENERLAYPLTFLPMELAGSRSRGWPVIVRQPMFWAGFLLAGGLAAMVGLHAYYPTVPAPNLAPKTEAVKNVWWLWFRMSMPMIGFFYLVNLDVTFSLWFFNLIFQVLSAIIKVLKLTSRENVGPFGANVDLFKYSGTGAFISLIISGLWVARPHLRVIWGRVKGSLGPEVDRDEILGYPTAFWLLLVSLIVMAVWLAATGLPWVVVPIFLLLALAIFLGLTRVVVEAGMAEAVAPSIAPGISAALLGTPIFGRAGMMALVLNYVWGSDIRTFVMASAANSLRMTTVVEKGHRRLFWAFLAAIALSFASSFYVTLSAGYRHGGASMAAWFFAETGVPTIGFKWAQARLAENAGPSQLGWITTAAGAGIYLLLAAARFRFINWPFHPIGFALAQTWIMDAIWFSPFLTWLLKSVFLRYGGMRTYLFMRPFFVGLIMGQYALNVLWLGIDKLTGHPGTSLFWI